MCQQGMEGNVGLTKNNWDIHGRGIGMELELMAKYLDMFILGGLKFDQHDLKQIARNRKRDNLMLYDPETTDDINEALEEMMPAKALEYLDLLEAIEYNDPSTVSPQIYDIFKTKLDECQIVSEHVNNHLQSDLMEESEWNDRFTNQPSNKPQSTSQMLSALRSLSDSLVNASDSDTNTSQP